MAAHFPHALQAMLTELDLSQYRFAEMTGMSQSMVGKLIHRDERASDDIYAKIFGYLKTETDAVPTATKTKFAGILARALLRDVIEDLQLPDVLDENSNAAVPDGSSSVPCSRGQSLVGGMFNSLPDKIILALFAIGKRARWDQKFVNLLYAQAEIANEVTQSAETSDRNMAEGSNVGTTFFPRGYFTGCLENRTEPEAKGLLKGPAGQLVLNLLHRDVQLDESE